MFLTNRWSMEIINHPVSIPLDHYFRYLNVLIELRAHFLSQANNQANNGQQQQQQHQGLPFAWYQ